MGAVLTIAGIAVSGFGMAENLLTLVATTLTDRAAAATLVDAFDGHAVAHLFGVLMQLMLVGVVEPTRPDLVATLTERETSVLRLIATGATNSEIGVTLVISEATVKTHVGRLLDKLAARDRVQLVLVAQRAGLT